MKLLLDTHVWVWSALEPCKVTSEVTHEMERAEALFLSLISILGAEPAECEKTAKLNLDFGEWCKRSIEERD